MQENYLRLEQQICFPLYASSRLLTRLYQPLLEALDLTYPQYLILLVLWEADDLPVKELGEKLFLESNTLTPLLKRMQSKGLISRQRSQHDERVVYIQLTEKGHKLKEQASCVPTTLLQSFDTPPEQLQQLHAQLWDLLGSLQAQLQQQSSPTQ